MLTEKNSFSFFLLRLVTSFAILLQSTGSFSPDRRYSCVLFVRFVCLSLVSFASYPKNALFFCVCAISWFGEFGRLPPTSMSLSALVVATLKLISVPLNCKLFLSLFHHHFYSVLHCSCLRPTLKKSRIVGRIARNYRKSLSFAKWTKTSSQASKQKVIADNHKTRRNEHIWTYTQMKLENSVQIRVREKFSLSILIDASRSIYVTASMHSAHTHRLST